MAISPETLTLTATLRTTLDAVVDDDTRRTVAAWVRAWDQIAGDWEAAAAQVTARADRVTAAELARLDRVTAALEHTAEQLGRLLGSTQVGATGAAADLIQLVHELTPRLIASQLPSTAGPTAALAVRFDRVDLQALQWIVHRTTQQVTALSQPLTQQATDAMLRQLISGVGLGLSPREAAARMLQGLETEFNGGLTRALTISRTEILDAYRASSKQTMEANDDVLAGWMWTAELDETTCESCWAMDGRVFDLDVDGPDDHQNGRCTRTPVTKTWRDLGFDVDEPEDQRPQAEDVFRALPEDQQLKIMGPTRLAGLNDGTIAWADLAQERNVTGWRRSFVPTPVGDLIPV